MCDGSTVHSEHPEAIGMVWFQWVYSCTTPRTSRGRVILFSLVELYIEHVSLISCGTKMLKGSEGNNTKKLGVRHMRLPHKNRLDTGTSHPETVIAKKNL